jgi:hypothetical protein
MPASRFTITPPELLPVTATRFAFPLKFFTAYETIFAIAWLSPPPLRVVDAELDVYVSSISFTLSNVFVKERKKGGNGDLLLQLTSQHPLGDELLGYITMNPSWSANAAYPVFSK